MKKRILSMAVALLLLCLPAGCQPTPEASVVVQHDEIEEKIAETPVPETTYEAPPHIKDSAEDGAMAVTIDADVILPDVSAYPVVRLEPLVLTQERVDELVHYFAGDRKLYKPGLLTKKDYEDALIRAKHGTEVDGEFVVTEDSQHVVEELEETIRNAPDDSPKIYADTTLTCNTNTDGSIDLNTSHNYLNVEIEDESGHKAGCIYFRNYVEDESNATEFSFLTANYTAETFLRMLVEQDQKMKAEYDPKALEKDTFLVDQMKTNQECYDKLMAAPVSMSVDDARTVAQKAIDDLKIQDMQLLTEERAILEDSGQGGYVFEYVRQSGGIAGFRQIHGGFTTQKVEPEYRPPFEQEIITVLVTDDGIQSFLWRGCAKPVETVTENAKLLPLEAVTERLKKQIFIERAYEAGLDTTQTITINVNTAELRTAYINVKDKLNEVLLVPAWVFQATSQLTAKDGRVFTSSADTYVFNAIDGGYMTDVYG